MQKILQKSRFNEFIKSLMKKYEVIAPVKQEVSKFNMIKEPGEIYLKEITQISAKKFFIPEKQVLFEFENEKIIENKEKNKKTIIFGLRKCDLNSLFILDKVMTDPSYINKRKSTILIGIHCENPDKYCFCNSMGLEDYYDLFFYPEKDKYYISIGSTEGKELVKELPNAEKEIKKQIKNIKKLENIDIGKEYQNEIWQTDVDKCLSCSACTVYCPTCNCFDISDTISINLKDGNRIRKEASCQLKSFSRVAGGKIFREDKQSRFKHFVFHKIAYYKQQHGRYMCVGCGRCLRVCPTKIDWVGTINLLK